MLPKDRSGDTISLNARHQASIAYVQNNLLNLLLQG